MAGSFPFRRNSFFLVLRGAVVAAALALPVHAMSAPSTIVRGVQASADQAATRVLVEIDGTYRYRTHTSEDGGSVLVDIEGVDLSEDVPRFLPVSDRRVDGIIVQVDAAARIVRVSVDVAGASLPEHHTVVHARGLEVRLGEPGSPSSSTAAVPSVKNAHDSWQSSAPTTHRPVLERPLVVLDPGHGGKDPGARAWTGEYEKDIVLDLAERVARRLRKAGDVDVVMTRSGDRYVTLEDRRDTSRRWGADVFVSIHANASHSAKARGVETYYHPRSSADPARADRETRRLVRIENGGKGSARQDSLRPGVAPASTGRRLPVDRRSESIRLAHLVQGQLVHRLGMRYETVRDLGAKEGPFFVIGENAAPSVLVEAAFLTHREEGLRMRSEVFREQIADGVARGIRAFLQEQQPGSL